MHNPKVLEFFSWTFGCSGGQQTSRHKKEENKITSKKEIVIELLKKDTDGLTIVDIAKKLKISRNTAAVALAELKGAELIRIRPVGIAKLHYWKGGKK